MPHIAFTACLPRNRSQKFRKLM